MIPNIIKHLSSLLKQTLLVIGTLEYRTNVIIEVCLQIGTKTIYETEKKQPSFSRRKKRFLLSFALFHLKHEIKHKRLWNCLHHTRQNLIKRHTKIRGLQFLDMLSLFERLPHFYRPIILAQVSFREIRH